MREVSLVIPKWAISPMRILRSRSRRPAAPAELRGAAAPAAITWERVSAAAQARLELRVSEGTCMPEVLSDGSIREASVVQLRRAMSLPLEVWVAARALPGMAVSGEVLRLAALAAPERRERREE